MPLKTFARVLLLLVVALLLWMHQRAPRESYTTPPPITEASVQKEIQQIRIQQQLFGFPTTCKKGDTSGAETHTRLKCGTVTTTSSWLPSETSVKTCFSKVIPLLENTKCNLHQNA